MFRKFFNLFVLLAVILSLVVSTKPVKAGSIVSVQINDLPNQYMYMAITIGSTQAQIEVNYFHQPQKVVTGTGIVIFDTSDVYSIRVFSDKIGETVNYSNQSKRWIVDGLYLSRNCGWDLRPGNRSTYSGAAYDIGNSPVLRGTVVTFSNSNEEVIACYQVTQEDTWWGTVPLLEKTETQPGFISGETVQVEINGKKASASSPFIFQPDNLGHTINLFEGYRTYMPMINK
jgi:hypothetical protein